eukprot:419539_1
MSLSSVLLTITTYIEFYIPVSKSQPICSSTSPPTTHQNENTHLYVIIGVLSTIILMLCVALFYFYCQYKKTKTNLPLVGMTEMIQPSTETSTVVGHDKKKQETLKETSMDDDEKKEETPEEERKLNTDNNYSSKEFTIVSE